MKKIFTLLLFATFASTISAQVAPTFNIESGTYYNPFNIELSGNNIYYTLDGSTPTTGSNLYTTAISISEFGTSTTINAASFDNGTWSEVISKTFELRVAAPVFSTKGGVYEKITDTNALKFTSETSGATIYYNERGGDPISEGSKPYGALSILATKTIKAVAFVINSKGDKVYSEISSEYYVISPIALYVSADNIENAKYLINCGDKTACSFYENTSQGNLNIIDVTSKNIYIETHEFCGFTFNSVNGGYTIRDGYGRYLYMNSDNILNASGSKPSSGAVWSVTFDNTTSQVTIKNTSKNKIIAYDTQEDRFGLYAENEIGENHELPKLYKNIEYPTITITPVDGDTLSEISKITVTCDAELKYKEGNARYAYYNVGQESSKIEFDYYEAINANTIEFGLDEPIKKSEDYKIVFPAKVFTIDPNGLAKTNKEIIMRYTIANRENLELTYSNPENNDITDSLKYLYFEFNQDIATTPEIENAIITDKNGNTYPLSKSNIDGWGNACAGNILCLMTENAILTGGEYTFILKKDYITAAENSELTIDKDYTYTFTVEESLKLESITPNHKVTYDEVKEIIITFNKAVWHSNIATIIVNDSENNRYTFTKTTKEEEKAKSLNFTTDTPITAKGIYTFTIAENSVYYEDPNSDMNEIEIMPETTFTFYVKTETSIEDINAEEEKDVIYDTLGRKVEKVTDAGIYIINGKKIIIK